MMPRLKIARSAKLRGPPLLVTVAGLGLPAVTIMPATRKCRSAPMPSCPRCRYLMPPMRSQKVVGWGEETPRWRRDCSSALATGFEHPGPSTSCPTETCWWSRARSEKRRSPAQGHITGWYSRSPAPRQRTPTAYAAARQWRWRSRAANHVSGSPHSPFGVALVGHDLLCANHRRHRPLSYQDGQTASPPRAPSHTFQATSIITDEGSVGAVRRLQALCRGRSTATSRKRNRGEYERAAIWEVDRHPARHRIFASAFAIPRAAVGTCDGKLWPCQRTR